MERSDALDALHTFRDSLYRCFDRRADALFELTDAILTAGVVPSPAHLSLEPSHRRGWGSLYAALRWGRIDAEVLRELLASHPLADAGEPPVYAVDVSVWDRCDAECSPERGYYYHPSRHSAGQPIVAGWAYQFIAQLNFARDSWVAPMESRRVHPSENTSEIAAEQADRWSWLIVVAYAQLRLARACVADLRLPWERRYAAGELTPCRVRRGVLALLQILGTPAKPPKPCGRSPGRPKGCLSGRARRYPAIKKVA